VRLRRPSLPALVTAALVVLLPALALLQYRWVGQVSEAERERMQRSLQHAALQFRESFDGEVSRAILSLQVDGATARDEAWGRYAERYATWTATAAQPAIVAAIFLVDADRSSVRLRRWNAETMTFEAAAWSGALAPMRAAFQSELAAFAADGNMRRLPPALRSDPSLIVSPLLHVRFGVAGDAELTVPPAHVFGFTAIQLDLPYIRTELLPALARRHFPQSGGSGPRVAVVDARDPREVVFRSSPDAPADPSNADVAEPLFSTFGDLLFFAHREPGRPVRETRNVVVSVLRERGEPGALRARILGTEAARWRLLVQDERGSLDAAVAAVRRRNLAISFGVLLLMGVSVAMLAASSRRARQLARQQMEFVAGVSHELRTPVAVIRSAAENLAQGVVDDPGRVRRYGEALETEARRLGEMVERVLQFAGIDAGRPFARTPLQIGPLVRAAADAAGRAHEEAVVEVTIGGDLPPVPGDETAIRSAIENLIANAAKYGGADRWIGVRAESSPGGAGEVRITVEDRGSGIPASELPHIFEPFYRGADAVARQVQGSGLGLALVRRVVEAHGGRVTVRARETGGTAFTIHLPAGPRAAEHPLRADQGLRAADRG
jgi:signal transduction histidine kinase